ncbi:ABC transporter permease [Clostridium botulinum]|uniref:ABC transporter permease n=1 Tax=Clostridium botulinum TaxID=1491 RepID=UPI0004D5C6FE|nr:ABC transporter permease [Clostridium botulinum]KEI06037.1 ABC transporter ATP-binding protein [Clostridium botulinum C/D str. BKT75002]KEI06866.1 ABC transporter ATP-binding protein [Clostridium botulinum C/D str. BKT2873]QPW61124.1 ABC transporter permease [Clostridium botulinum]
MKSYLDVTTKYLKFHWKRTLLTILGVIMSVALLSGLATIYYSYKDYTIAEAKRTDGNYEVSFKDINKAQIDTIKNTPAVCNIGISQSIGKGKLRTEAKKNSNRRVDVPSFKYLDIKALDTNSLNNIFKPTLVAGRYPKNKNELLVQKSSLKFLGKNITINSKVKFPLGKIQEPKEIEDSPKNDSPNENIFISQNECEYTIVGIMRNCFFNHSNSFFDGITVLENKDLFNKASNNNAFTVYASILSKKNKCEIGAAIANSIGIKVDLATLPRYSLNTKLYFNDPLLRLYNQGSYSNIDSRLNLTILFMTFIIIICTIAIIYNSINISVLERISEFGILRSIGATPAQIRKMVFKESFIISIIGIPLGIISGVIATKIVLYIAGSLLMKNGFDPFEVFIYPGVIIISIILGLITVLLSTFGPSITAGRVSPLEAIKNSKNYKVGKIKRVPKGRLSKLLFKVEGQLAYRNITRNKKRFIVTVFSLVISIIMFISFNSFADYMKLQDEPTTLIYHDACYSSNDLISKAEYNNILKQRGIEKIYNTYETCIDIAIPNEKYNDNLESGINFESCKIKNINMVSGKLIGYDKESLKLCRNHILSGNYNDNDLNNMGVFLIDRNFNTESDEGKLPVSLTKYKVGDIIKFPKLEKYYDNNDNCLTNAINSNNFYELKILGILKQNPLSNDTMQRGIHLITSSKTYEKIMGLSDNLYEQNLYIKFAPNANRDALKTYFDKKINDECESYTDYLEIIEKNRKQAFQISIFVYGFISVISLIGAINIINTISTSLLIRRREFAVLKSIGMSQNQLKKMVLLEGAFHGIAASFFGSILGSMCSLILNRPNYPSIGDMYWSTPWRAILISTIGTIMISLISSLFPLRKISKDSIIENIRVEE